MRSIFHSKALKLAIYLLAVDFYKAVNVVECSVQEAEFVVSSSTWGLPRTPEPTSNTFVESCATLLQNVASPSGGEINRETYVELLANVTSGKIAASRNVLPLELIGVFNVMACANGRPCVGSQASIPVSNPSDYIQTCSFIENSLHRLSLLPSNKEYGGSRDDTSRSTIIEL